ncbi:MAG: LuxR family transcriptional regulator [Steroidobacteraceae bacterium]
MQRARTTPSLQREMEKFSRQQGFERSAYALRIAVPSLTPRHFALNGYPQAWGDRYVAQGYFKVDPIVQHCERSTRPAIWDERAFHGDETQGFWEEAQAFGLQSGLSFAVHEQPGVTGIFSLSRDRKLDLPAQDLAALIGRVQVFASLLHHAVARINLPSLLPRAHVHLTPRERECLKWTADGKTAWETSRILGITERTAVFHMDNVIQKLGAANKTQAVVRAMALNLIF